MDPAGRLEHFLTLATGALVGAGKVRAVVSAGETEGAQPPLIVDILYQPVRRAPRGPSGIPEPLFTLADIAGREEECFGNWFAKDWLDPITALYFGTLYNPSRYLDLNFLVYTHAVEAYHRRASGETDLPEAEHGERIGAILEAAPLEHRHWLGEKLRYSNELSLRRRLKALFAQFSYLLDEDLISDRKGLISAICDNRNYLTHYDQTLKTRAAAGARLVFMVEALKLILQACFLRELGFSDDMVKVSASRSRSLRTLRHLKERASVGT